MYLQVSFYPCEDGLLVEAAHGLEVESVHDIVHFYGLGKRKARIKELSSNKRLSSCVNAPMNEMRI
jgi:hypothetical protein